VELTAKKPDELEKKVRSLVYKTKLGGGYRDDPYFTAIWFYVPDEKRKKSVEGVIEKLRTEERERVSVGIWEDVWPAKLVSKKDFLP